MTKVQSMTNAALVANTATERLNSFLLIDPAGLPGATELRKRQERIKTRLACKPVHPMTQWYPTAAPYPDHSVTTGYEIAAKPLARTDPNSVTPFRHGGQYASRNKYRAWTLRGVDIDARRAAATGDAGLALDLAAAYHEHIGTLYTSKRAEIAYGRTSRERTDWDAYAKSYHHPANWKDAAAHIEYRADGPVVILHTTRDRAITVPLVRGVDYAHAALIDGDLYGRLRHGVVERFGAKGKRTGFAVQFPAIGKDGRYWEHGKTVTDCRAEYARKLKLHQDRERLASVTRRQQRKARLIARLCRRLACTIEDARAAGYCTPGIDGFRQRFGLGDSATVAELRATGRYEVGKVIERAALRCATA